MQNPFAFLEEPYKSKDPELTGSPLYLRGSWRFIGCERRILTCADGIRATKALVLSRVSCSRPLETRKFPLGDGGKPARRIESVGRRDCRGKRSEPITADPGEGIKPNYRVRVLSHCQIYMGDELTCA